MKKLFFLRCGNPGAPPRRGGVSFEGGQVMGSKMSGISLVRSFFLASEASKTLFFLRFRVGFGVNKTLCFLDPIRFQAEIGPTWANLDQLEADWGPLGANLGPTWGQLGGNLGGNLGKLGHVFFHCW